MPKLVDHDARREELGAALWRVVARDGIEAASLRRVAAEAGWSVGSLRHYFATQAQLLTFAMELVSQRVRQRVGALPVVEDGPSAALALACEVLPLDAERRTEAQVWLACTSAALVDPGLRTIHADAHAGLRNLSRRAAGLAGASPARLEAAAERLHALLDGLAVHALLDPELTTPARMRQLVAAQLDEL